MIKYTNFRSCVCCHHFKETDYRNKASNFLNATAVPKIYVPETERRNKRVNEMVVIATPIVPTNQQQEIFIELDSGDKMEYQSTNKFNHILKSEPKLMLPQETPGKPRLEEIKNDQDFCLVEDVAVTLSDDEDMQDKNPDEVEVIQDPFVKEDEPFVVNAEQIEEPEQLTGPEMTHEDLLREHYSNYTKEELIEFLVKSRVLFE